MCADDYDNHINEGSFSALDQTLCPAIQSVWSWVKGITSQTHVRLLLPLNVHAFPSCSRVCQKSMEPYHCEVWGAYKSICFYNPRRFAFLEKSHVAACCMALADELINHSQWDIHLEVRGRLIKSLCWHELCKWRLTCNFGGTLSLFNLCPFQS